VNDWPFYRNQTVQLVDKMVADHRRVTCVGDVHFTSPSSCSIRKNRWRNRTIMWRF